MAITGANVAYACAGGLILFSGIKGSTLSNTLQQVLKGNLNVSDTETLTNISTSDTANSTDSVTDTGSSTNSATANQAIAKQIIQSTPAYSGWDTGQTWNDLVSLWTKESGWSATADNPTSGAYGIAQALPPTKYPTAGQAPPVGTSNPGAQISWGLDYIASRYGSPVMAWAHEVSNNWY